MTLGETCPDMHLRGLFTGRNKLSGVMVSDAMILSNIIHSFWCCFKVAEHSFPTFGVAILYLLSRPNRCR